jgi:very-short-patch-repair endonuclease/predicted transcriptional regulator of viral defense system
MGAIRPKVLTPEQVDAVIVRLAADQHRLVTRRRLLAAGVGSEAITHRLARHRLHRVHRGVYAVGTPKLDLLGCWLAAVLACADGSVLSHRSAAALWGLLDRKPGPVEVTVPGRWRSRRAGITVHATRSLPTSEIKRRQGIPCTSVERTLVDLADGTAAEVERAVEQAFALRLLGRTRMADALERADGRAGVGDLRRLLGRLLNELPLTRSDLERRFLGLVAGAGLPVPRVNRRRVRHRVDFVWPEPGVIVETDGRATHDNPFAFHRDRARDLDLELAGWHVIRLTWWQVTEESELVVELLRRTFSGAVQRAA